MARRIIVVAVVAFALRLAVTLSLPSRPFSDFATYLSMAEALADSGSLRWIPPMHPPGYSAALASVFVLVPDVDRLLVAKLANCALGVATVLIGAGLARRLWGEGAGFIAAVALALFPRQLLLPSLIASENLFTPLLFVFVGLVAGAWNEDTSVRRSAAAGAVLGGMALTRTVAYFAGIVWVAAARAGGRKWRDIAREFAILLLVQHAVMLPWAVSNHLHHGRFTFLTCSGGMGLFIGNNEHATGMWYPGWKEDLEALRPGIGERPEFEVDDAARAEAVRWILDNPGRAARLYLARLKWIFTEDKDAVDWATNQAYWSQEGSTSTGTGPVTASDSWLTRNRLQVMAATRVCGWLVIVTGALGVILALRRHRRSASAGSAAALTSVLGATTYVALVAALIAVNGRYRWPVEDLAVLFMSLAVATLAVNRGAHEWAGRTQASGNPRRPQRGRQLGCVMSRCGWEGPAKGGAG
ncbi:MAG: ArnT family glycosyltransferase [Acidobacteriota bacterium]